MNYHIRESDGNDILCPDSFCPMKTLDLKLHVTYESQHDGRSWWVANSSRKIANNDDLGTV